MSFLLKDGGIGTALAASLPPDLPVCDLLNVSQPEAVLAVHQAFYAAGARLLTSNTFCCDPDSLAGTAFAGQAEELCRLGAELARSAAGPGAQVAGSLGPGWRYPSKGEIGLSELSESYALRARGLLRGGADLLWIETVQDPLQAQAAVAGCRQALRALGRQVPIAVLISLQSPTSLLGDQPHSAVLQQIEALDIEILGVNCSQGPESTYLALDWLAEHSRKQIACCPNAGPDPANYLDPAAFAAATGWVKQAYAPAILGGCCGVSSEHICVLAKRLGEAHTS